MVLAQLKIDSFSLHPPTSQESICFCFCRIWRRFVYGRSSNLISKALLVSLGSCLHWYCFSFCNLPPPLSFSQALKFLLCCLCCFLIKAVCEKMSLNAPIQCGLERTGERPCRACRNGAGNVRMFQAIEKSKMYLLHTVIQPS